MHGMGQELNKYSFKHYKDPVNVLWLSIVQMW